MSVPKWPTVADGVDGAEFTAQFQPAFSAAARGLSNTEFSENSDKERRGESSTPVHLLVVDDDPDTVTRLSRGLGFVGYQVQVARSGIEAMTMVRLRIPDLIVLEVTLSDLDGFEFLRQLRARAVSVPVVFLTANDRMSDKVAGLRVGGDDYITKPFGLEEVIARVGSLLRRTHLQSWAQAERSVLRFLDLELDEDTHDVRRGGRLIRLSLTEFKLLRLLMRHPDQVLSKSQILERVWPLDFDGDPRIVESYISMLRRKIDKSGPSLIHTLRSVGYSLRAPAC